MPKKSIIWTASQIKTIPLDMHTKLTPALKGLLTRIHVRNWSCLAIVKRTYLQKVLTRIFFKKPDIRKEATSLILAALDCSPYLYFNYPTKTARRNILSHTTPSPAHLFLKFVQSSPSDSFQHFKKLIQVTKNSDVEMLAMQFGHWFFYSFDYLNYDSRLTQLPVDAKIDIADCSVLFGNFIFTAAHVCAIKNTGLDVVISVSSYFNYDLEKGLYILSSCFNLIDIELYNTNYSQASAIFNCIKYYHENGYNVAIMAQLQKKFHTKVEPTISCTTSELCYYPTNPHMYLEVALPCLYAVEAVPLYQKTEIFLFEIASILKLCLEAFLKPYLGQIFIGAGIPVGYCSTRNQPHTYISPQAQADVRDLFEKTLNFSEALIALQAHITNCVFGYYRWKIADLTPKDKDFALYFSRSIVFFDTEEAYPTVYITTAIEIKIVDKTLTKNINWENFNSVFQFILHACSQYYLPRLIGSISGADKANAINDKNTICPIDWASVIYNYDGLKDLLKKVDPYLVLPPMDFCIQKSNIVLPPISYSFDISPTYVAEDPVPGFIERLIKFRKDFS